MKTADAALFDPDGRFVATIARNRIVGHSLAQNEAGELVASAAWEQKLTHVSSLVIGEGVVVATNTSGHHIGIDGLTGELLWDRAPPVVDGQHEGKPGIIRQIDGQACFVYASWGGLLTQYVLATGVDVAPPCSPGLRMPRLCNLPDGRLAAIGSELGDNRPRYYLATVDLDRRSTEELRDLGFIHDLFPNRAGDRALMLEIHVPPGTEDVSIRERGSHWVLRMSLIEMLSGESLAARDFALDGLNTFYTTWSQDGGLIGMGSSTPAPARAKSHLILDGSDLSTVAEIGHEDPRTAPAFHPHGEHVLLPRGKKSPLGRLASLAGS